MKQNAIVIEISGDMALVGVVRQSACGENCASCGAKCASERREARVEAFNRAAAEKGDKVVVYSSSKKLLGAAAMVYFVPVLFFVLGVIISGAAGLGEGAGALLSIAAFLLGMALAVVYNRKEKKNGKIRHIIVEILK